MSETCIVCLGDLGETAVEPAPSALPTAKSPALPAQAEPVQRHWARRSKSPFLPDDASNALIAHLLPCGHNLHNECLKPWVERANSCPICRQNFNEVELCTKIGGPTCSSYPVLDRTQVAELDPSMVVDDDEYDDIEDRPCSVCQDNDHEEVLLACDGCNAYYHTYCIGLDELPPGRWYCETCDAQRALQSVCPLTSQAAPTRPHNPPDRRTRLQQRRARARNQTTSLNWARVWQNVWDRLNLDLDFPFDDDDDDSAQLERSQRATSQRRDFRQWERRLRVAERQGGANRFRETAPVLLDLRTTRERPQPPEPESQEELRAWNAFEKAKEIEGDSVTRRKRKSLTASPSEAEPTLQSERPLKRPRTRRIVDANAAPSATPNESRRSSAAGPSSFTSTRHPPAPAQPGPSFLQSMLREIETSTTLDDGKSPMRLNLQAGTGGHASPPPLSPGSSPTTSNHASPRARSITPPLSASSRPGSPFSLTSKVEPIFPPAEFSPNRSPTHDRPISPAVESTSVTSNGVPNGVKRPGKVHGTRTSPRNLQLVSRNGSSPAGPVPANDCSSPTRLNMPYSTKADLQRMVSLALKPHYQSNALSKEEYTDINRNVSRMLYDRVGESGQLDLGLEREHFEQLAGEEVAKAVREIRSAAAAASS